MYTPFTYTMLYALQADKHIPALYDTLQRIKFILAILLSLLSYFYINIHCSIFLFHKPFFVPQTHTLALSLSLFLSLSLSLPPKSANRYLYGSQNQIPLSVILASRSIYLSHCCKFHYGQCTMYIHCTQENTGAQLMYTVHCTVYINCAPVFSCVIDNAITVHSYAA